MWEFRRDPKDTSPEDKAKLEALFAKLPQLRKLHQARVRFKQIFDTAPNRKKAARQLCDLHLQIMDDGLEDTGTEPALGLLIDGVVWRQVVRHVAPRGTRSDDPAEAIEHLTQVMVALWRILRNRRPVGPAQ